LKVDNHKVAEFNRKEEIKLSVGKTFLIRRVEAGNKRPGGR